MPIIMKLDDTRNIADLRIFDEVRWEDFHSVASTLEAFILSNSKVRLLQVIEGVDRLDPDLLWDGLRFDRKIVSHVSHCALVGDLNWLRPLERAKDALLPMELRLYSHRMEGMARQWVHRAGSRRTHVIGHGRHLPARSQAR